MGRRPIIRKDHNEPDTFNLRLPAGYKDGTLTKLAAHYGISATDVIYKALESLWEKRHHPSDIQMSRLADVGFVSVSSDLLDLDLTDVLERSSKVFLKGKRLDQFFSRFRHHHAFLSRAIDPSKFTAIEFSGSIDLSTGNFLPYHIEKPYLDECWELAQNNSDFKVTVYKHFSHIQPFILIADDSAYTNLFYFGGPIMQWRDIGEGCHYRELLSLFDDS